jgi:hypothetical protein
MKDLSSEIKQALLAPFEAAEIRIKTQPYIAAFCRRVKRAIYDENGCLVWRGAKHSSGYGSISIRLNGKQYSAYAHRVAYEFAKGPIPDGLVIDHLCRNRACVNPDHLEAVTDRVNILRGESPAACSARRSCCPKGHSYTEKNTYFYKDGSRACRKCNCENQRKRNALKPKSPPQTHCLRGHEFTLENTRLYNGRRHCRKCAVIYARNVRAMEKAA